MIFLILLNWILTKLKDAFYRFLKFKIIFRIKQVKVGHYNRYLWEAQTKTAKIDYFTINLSPLMFFETKTSNFQEMLIDIFKIFCIENFFLIKKRKKKKNKN